MSLDRRQFLTRGLALGAACGLSGRLASPAIGRPANAPYSIFDFAGGQALAGKNEETSDFTTLIKEAVAQGSPISFPSGRYPLRTLTTKNRCVSLISDAPIDIVCESGATFIAGQELSGNNAALLGLQNSNPATPGTKTTFRFKGGHFDGSQLTNSGSFGIGMLDIFQYADPVFENISGYGGTSDFTAGRAGAGWADTLLTTHNCFRERVTNLKGKGFFDTLLYLSGDNRGDQLDGIGEQALVSGLEAARCGNGVVMKRDHVGQVIQNFTITDCLNGVIGSSADGRPANQGKRTHVQNGTLRRIQGRPVVIFGTDVLAENLTIEDFGLQLADLNSVTGTRRGNEVAGIDFRGAKNGQAINNAISLKKWFGMDGPSARQRYGIALRKDANHEPTQGCTISNNRISGFATPVFVEKGCEDNRIPSTIMPR